MSMKFLVLLVLAVAVAAATTNEFSNSDSSQMSGSTPSPSGSGSSGSTAPAAKEHKFPVIPVVVGVIGACLLVAIVVGCVIKNKAAILLKIMKMRGGDVSLPLNNDNTQV